MSVVLSIHKPRESLLTLGTEGPLKWTGAANYVFLLVGLMMIVRFIEAYIEHGLKSPWINMLDLPYPTVNVHLHLWLMLYLVVPAAICYTIEKSIATGAIAEDLGLWMHSLNLFAVGLVPIATVNIAKDYNFLHMFEGLKTYVVVILKLSSYVQVNVWSRVQGRSNCSEGLQTFPNGRSETVEATEENSETVKISKRGAAERNEMIQEQIDNPPISYPDNVTCKNLVYFLLVPTLCYELEFPRLKKIRKRLVAEWLFQLAVFMSIHLLIHSNLMIPSVKTMLLAYASSDTLRVAKSFLDVVVYMSLLWILVAYIQFHLVLNIFAEFLLFGDRQFYKDWWNANDTDSFWRIWNMPAHYYAVRHVYFPMIEMDFEKSTAKDTTFFVSAFFHEFWFGTLFKNYSQYSFFAMMVYVPLGTASSYVRRKCGDRWGSLMLWTCMIMLQGASVTLYTIDHFLENGGVAAMGEFAGN